MRKLPAGFETTLLNLDNDQLDGASIVINAMKDYGLQPEDVLDAISDQMIHNDAIFETSIDEVMKVVGHLEAWSLDNYIVKIACDQGEHINECDLRYQVGWLLKKAVTPKEIYNYLNIEKGE